jgi:3'-phosphoadenosine 5'-phosphosulfate (PAPS) 3'-phosphatase
LPTAIIGLSGHAAEHLGWRQFRALGALALDLCAVAQGRLDGFLDCSVDAHGVWDYLGGMLVCQEAGVTVVDARRRDLVVLDPGARRTPVAGSASLVEELVAAWPRAVASSTPRDRPPDRPVGGTDGSGPVASVRAAP